MEYLVRFNGERNRWVSDPPGLEIWFESPEMAFVFSDGRLAAFDSPRGGFDVQPDGKLVSFVASENRFVSDDGTIIFYFDAARSAWVVNESDDPRFRVTSSITGGGTVSGTGFFEAGTPITIRATPNAGWELKTLTIGGAAISNPYTFNMPSSNVVVVAVFEVSATFITTEGGKRLLTETGKNLIL